MTKSKRGNILTENVVFIVITLLFIATLFIFVARSSATVSLVEEANAKKLALMIDSARPETKIIYDIRDLIEKKEYGINNEDVITITGNTVQVKLSKESGYSYDFFNNVDVKIGSQGVPDGYISIVISDKVQNV